MSVESIFYFDLAIMEKGCMNHSLDCMQQAKSQVYGILNSVCQWKASCRFFASAIVGRPCSTAWDVQATFTIISTLPHWVIIKIDRARRSYCTKAKRIFCLILASIGSQCRVHRWGEVWSIIGAVKIRWAALFWTFWRLFRRYRRRPERRELQ